MERLTWLVILDHIIHQVPSLGSSKHTSFPFNSLYNRYMYLDHFIIEFCLQQSIIRRNKLVVSTLFLTMC